METFSTPCLVVAAALIDENGMVLMQRRRFGGDHGGLWEFPGGKVEPGETPESALLREIDEELGITLARQALHPLAFASEQSEQQAPIVILLYMCRQWQGEPRARFAEEIAWVEPAALAGLEMPPLDYPLADALCAKVGNE